MLLVSRRTFDARQCTAAYSKSSARNAKLLKITSKSCWRNVEVLALRYCWYNRLMLSWLVWSRLVRGVVSGLGGAVYDGNVLDNMQRLVNVCNLPLSLHHSTKGGLIHNPVLVDVLGLITSVASFRSGWIATAVPSIPAPEIAEIVAPPVEMQS